MPRYQRKPTVVEAYQWNPPEFGIEGFPYGRPKDWENTRTDHVRKTTYLEVARLLETSGCSKEQPHWDYSVMGVIDTISGPHTISPGDYVVVRTPQDVYPVKRQVFESIYDRIID